MELRQLHYFIAVAEELNFTNAALKLHIAQQPVSVQIKKLEDEIGVKLFERTTRQVILTPEGSAFLTEVRQVFNHLDKAVEDARAISKGKAFKINMGYESATTCRILPICIKRIHSKLPKIKIELHELEAHEIYNKINNRDIDLGLMFLDKEYLEFDEFEVKRLGSDRSVVAFPKGHFFSDKENISLCDLSKEPFVVIKRSVKPNFYNKFMRLCKNAGFEPNIVQEVTSEQALMSLVAEGIGVTIVFDCLRDTFNEDVDFVPLINPEIYIDYGFLWKNGNKSSHINSITNIDMKISKK
ncbi:LysR family transcriptional regulator [Alkalibaculum sp. M08DMB]|uniref:LysR family transcriptional regulator n=1 Tax=Alkalibaculum sporogenes TaxID=2655001 RepID=A0A6A7K5V2_9FIRM|nr:LysR substrate-binding domain-containing protein [Alkalibaculum sporogenes]MPW24734.1 LysR family transcriptional regulator [Alkalibaculum sporogenes]